MRGRIVIIAAAALALAVIAGWFAARHFAPASVSGQDRQAVEQIVHDYLLTHPEIIPEAMEALQRREAGQQLAGVREQVEAPFPGAVLGNPRAAATLVEFSDYACGYCRRSVADVDALLKKDPDLRVVVRELPILSPESGEAARMALAAAEQGKYAAFHQAMFAAERLDAASINAAATAAGLDLAKAQATAKSPRVSAEIERNLALARQLGFNGTPSWIVGEATISGAVGVDELAKAIAQARR